MRTLLTRIPARGYAVGVAVVIVAGAVVGLVVGALAGDWSALATTTPTGDAAVYLLDAATTADGSGIVVHGYYTVLELGHPGPVFAWTLAGGVLVGRLFGIDPLVGAIAANMLACVGFLVAGGVLLARAMRSALAGSLAVLGFVALGARYVPDNFNINPFLPYPLYGPIFAAHLAFAGSAALVFACSRSLSGGRWPCVVTGTMLYLHSIETIPLGIVVAGVGVAGVVLEAVRRGRAHPPSGWRYGFVGLVVCGLVASPLVVRMLRDGWDLPIQYVHQYLEYRRNRTPDPSATPQWDQRIQRSSGGVRGSALLVLVGTVIACTGALVVTRSTRRAGIGVCVLLAHAALITVLGEFAHQVTPIAPMLPITLGIAIGVGVSSTLRTFNMGNAWRSKPLGSVLLGVVVLTSAGGMYHTALDGRDIAELSVRGRTATKDLGDVIAESTRGAEQVGALFVVDRTYPTKTAEVLYAAKRAGVDLCMQHAYIARGRSGTPMYPYCAADVATTWVVFSTAGRIQAGDPVLVYDVDPRIDGLPHPIPVEVHITHDPRQLGFIQCTGPHGELYSWSERRSCDTTT